MLIGYARVSTTDQSLDLQLDALEKAGCEKVFQEKRSGVIGRREGLTDVLDHLREGDTLVVYKLDRLGRNMKNLISLMSDLEERKVQFKSLTEGIDTSTPIGRFTFHLLGAIAEMERDLLAERTKAGLTAARKRGRTGGRPVKFTDSKIEKAKMLLKAGALPVDVARDFGVSLSTLYRKIPADEQYEIESKTQ